MILLTPFNVCRLWKRVQDKSIFSSIPVIQFLEMRVDNLPDQLKVEEQDGHQNGFTDDAKSLSNAKDGVMNSESATLQKVERLKTIDADDSMSGLSFKGIETPSLSYLFSYI